MKISWMDRARAALAAYDDYGKFSADVLKIIVRDHERPDIAALYQGTENHEALSAYVTASKAWEAENPGSSDSNMRRVCEKLVAEGVLGVQKQIKGYHSWYWYFKPKKQGVQDGN